MLITSGSVSQETDFMRLLLAHVRLFPLRNVLVEFDFICLHSLQHILRLAYCHKNDPTRCWEPARAP